MPDVIEATILKEFHKGLERGNYYVHIIYDGIWPVKNRDIVMESIPKDAKEELSEKTQTAIKTAMKLPGGRLAEWTNIIIQQENAEKQQEQAALMQGGMGMGGGMGGMY